MNEEFKAELKLMLKRKEDEMIEFLNDYMTIEERTRIGQDIIRNMPNMGDIAMIQMNLLVKSIESGELIQK